MRNGSDHVLKSRRVGTWPAQYIDPRCRSGRSADPENADTAGKPTSKTSAQCQGIFRKLLHLAQRTAQPRREAR